MSIFELCHKNLDKEENEKKDIPSWNPCLKVQFHEGKCNHEDYCNDVSCSCKSILKRMSSGQKYMYLRFKEEKEKYDGFMSRILKKYEVKNG